MAPTSTAPNAAPTSTEFDGDDFSNNLFSDLAPLLTLFGEQVTKQFFSLSFGWADHILLAMGPLGIITIVVSAIRVSGPKRLKAIVGRARESLATAEAELLSSTSQNVCEMWDGHQVVREIGQRINGSQNLLILKNNVRPHAYSNDEELHILDLKQAVHGKYLMSMADPFPVNLGQDPPDITLNIADSISSASELWFWVLVGVMLQTTALVVPGLTVYLWKWQKDGEHIASYGYPCFLSGSLGIIVGILGCSYVIEGMTKESTFTPTTQHVHGFMNLQKSGTVGDQHFSSYAIFSRPRDLTLRVSHLKAESEVRPSSLLAATSTFVTIAGYVVQFVGLRSLHWSATIIQLGVTLAMTCCRARVRRGLTAQPMCVPLRDADLAALTTLFALTEDYEDKYKSPDQIFRDIRGWQLYSGRKCLNSSSDWSPTCRPEITFTPYETNNTVQAYQKVRKSLEWPSESFEWSRRLCAAVEGILKHLLSTDNMPLKEDGAKATGRLFWTVNTIHERFNTDNTASPASFGHLTAGIARKSGGNAKDQAEDLTWTIDLEEIQSIMDLWACSIGQKDGALLAPSGVLQIVSKLPLVNDDRISYTHISGQLSLDANEAHSILDWFEDPDLILAKKASVRPASSAEKWGLTISRDSGSPFVLTVPPEAPTKEGNKWLTHALVTTNTYVIRHACALEILSLFLSAISSQIAQIKGNTRIIPNGRERPLALYDDSRFPSERTEPLWTNTAIDKLSHCLVKAGLVGTIAQANLFVIPALNQYVKRRTASLTDKHWDPLKLNAKH